VAKTTSLKPDNSFTSPYVHTYAFGDSANDIDMLKFVKYGIAMENSSSEILEMVKYKTDNIENDGIYKGLKQFKLI
jgi:hydroxymethylpyrimidine pyrophosphatase-like HAD family hydrolase